MTDATVPKPTDRAGDGPGSAPSDRALREGRGTVSGMARLRLFASARELAGTREDDVPGDTVAGVLEAAVARYGSAFAGVLDSATIWCNGETVTLDHPVTDGDEVAVLPPVSGGTDGSARGR